LLPLLGHALERPDLQCGLAVVPFVIVTGFHFTLPPDPHGRVRTVMPSLTGDAVRPTVRTAIAPSVIPIGLIAVPKLFEEVVRPVTFADHLELVGSKVSAVDDPHVKSPFPRPRAASRSRSTRCRSGLRCFGRHYVYGD